MYNSFADFYDIAIWLCTFYKEFYMKISALIRILKCDVFSLFRLLKMYLDFDESILNLISPNPKLVKVIWHDTIVVYLLPIVCPVVVTMLKSFFLPGID